MIQVGKTGPAAAGGAAELSALKEQYRERDHVRLPGFLAADLLREIQAELKTASFVHKKHEGIGQELVCFDSVAGDELLFLMNDPRLFEWVSAVTGCGQIGCFLGRLYRMSAGHAHHESWHSDMGAHRLVALSVNLSEEPYGGGTLILRAGGLPETERRIPNLVPGDALLFRIAPDLEHWISDVEAGPPKTAWAGWFRSEPPFMEVLAGKRKLSGE